MAARRASHLEMALRLARFPYVQTLETFDFEAQLVLLNP